jgi:hypothetical protein
MTVDALTYMQKLEAAGVDRKQAEAHAEALGRALSDDYVSKDYLETKLAEFRRDVFKAMVVQTIAQLIVIGGLGIAAVELLR